MQTFRQAGMLAAALWVTAAAEPALQLPRRPDGDGTVTITGELKQWHKVTLTLDGPYAHELDRQPNPFTDCALWVEFSHESGRKWMVPGYFAADGNAAESSADSGTKWRAHLAPELAGAWSYTVSFATGERVALARSGAGTPLKPFAGKAGRFTVAPSDKQAPDFRARGRLAYAGGHHLRFLGDGSYFLKAGPDAPETLLACADFDGTAARKRNAPLKTWAPHARDWRPGDPAWQGGKGKGLIGALNYLAAAGLNSFSFLPYNVGGDGDNVWPFAAPAEKFHYDCSKLDQWGIVFDHATRSGLHLHFKLQENEIDDDRPGQQDRARPGAVPASLDGGRLGPERTLYCRELAARFAHALALNWNIGEENTQSTAEVEAMAQCLRDFDPYEHPIVLHTFPNEQDKRYRPLAGRPALTGLSLQNGWRDVHRLTVKWLAASAAAGHPWVVANDEQNPANLGVPPDPGYPGKTKAPYTIDDIRKFTLWGNLLAGGAGVEYYFGYELAQNDLQCEDWRSRAKSWDYCRIALKFFRSNNIPFHEMRNADELVGNPDHGNSRYCLAKDGGPWLVYLPEGGSAEIRLPAGGPRSVAWFNPRTGEQAAPAPLPGRRLAAPDTGDWLALIR